MLLSPPTALPNGCSFASTDVDMLLYQGDGTEKGLVFEYQDEYGVWRECAYIYQPWATGATVVMAGEVDLSDYDTRMQTAVKLALKADKSALDAQQARIDALLLGADGSVDTFIEAYNRFIANEDAAAALTQLVNTKAPLASPALTGLPTAPTAPTGTRTEQLATTAFVGQQNRAVFGAPCFALFPDREPQGFASIQQAMLNVPQSGRARLVMNASTSESLMLDRSVEIVGNGYNLAALTVTKGAVCAVTANVVNTTQQLAVNVSTGKLTLLGNITHSSDVANNACVQIYPSGSFTGRGIITHNSTHQTSYGYVANGETTFDFDGWVIVTNKGVPLRLTGTCTVRGSVVSADAGVFMGPVGRVDFYSSVDTRNSASSAPSLLVGQNAAFIPADGQYFALHSGTELLAAPGVASIVNANVPVVQILGVSSSVTYSQRPIAADLKLRILDSPLNILSSDLTVAQSMAGLVQVDRGDGKLKRLVLTNGTPTWEAVM